MNSPTAPTLLPKMQDRIATHKDRAHATRVSLPAGLDDIDIDPAYKPSGKFREYLPRPFAAADSRITRSDLMEHGRRLTPASGPNELREFLYLVNAWGYGSAGYGLWRTKQVLGDGDGERFVSSALGALTILHDRSLSDAAVVAYYYLNNHSQGRVRWWGPAFFTKFLTFVDPAHHDAGVGAQRAPALILDRWMGVAVRELAGRSMPGYPLGGWTTPQYAYYLELMAVVAASPSFEAAPYDGRPRNVERALFAHYRVD